MSSSILSTVDSTSRTVKSRLSSLRNTQGSCPCDWPICAIIGLAGMPNTGSALITPTTGRSAWVTLAIARTISYSSNRSRLGDRKGIETR